MNEQWRSRITVERGKPGGRPCIRGMRITVYDVLSYLATGMTVAEVLDDFPYPTPEDVQACFAFAAERERSMLVAVAFGVEDRPSTTPEGQERQTSCPSEFLSTSALART
jgi:uncharacterized protein (DUF433 family)